MKKQEVYGGDGAPQEKTASSTTATTGAKQGDTGGLDGVVGEVTSLLKSMRTPPHVRALLSRTSTTEDGVLLDSGATHCLRKPYSDKEWEEAQEIEVQTAVGMAKLRQSGNFDTLLTKDEGTQPILALGLLTEAGLKVTWRRQGCHIMGMRLMREVEEIKQTRVACLRSLRTGEKDDLAVSYRVLAALCPEAPQQELEGLCTMRQYDPERLSWNRRRRRALEKAGHCASLVLRSR